MKESKESKNRFVSNGSESFKLKKLKEKDVLKSKKLHRKDKDLTQIDKLKKKNGKEKVASKKLEKSKKDLSMKNQDILSNGKLIKKEKLIEFNVLKNLADWRLNLSLGLEEKNRLSMNSNSMLKDLFK